MLHRTYVLTMLIAHSFMWIDCASKESSENPIAPIEQEGVVEFAPRTYASNCASCHGVDVRAFADRKNWIHGSDKDSLIFVISKGLVDKGMPAFEGVYSQEEIASLADYILEAKEQVGTYAFEDKFDDKAQFLDNGVTYELELVTDAVNIPWGIAQSNDGTLFITDRDGTLTMRSKNGSIEEITGVPSVREKGQGGLLDVSLDPDFDKNQHIYLSYSKYNPKNKEEGTTAVFKGRLEGNRIVDGRDIWVALPYYATQYHFGSRLLWDKDGLLYVSIGDRGKRDINPQDLGLYPGKIHRINSDGSIPSDNPFVGKEGVVASIYSYGHRNPQGLAYDRQNDVIYENEHGPRGGDEINIIEPGRNYGWPVISYGINYNGTVFTTKTAEEGMEQPLHYWVPAIGVCGMAYVDSDRYPEWKGQLMSGSLKYQYLNLTRILDDGMVEETKLFPKIGRLRSILQGTDGYLYIGVEDPGRVYRILRK